MALLIEQGVIGIITGILTTVILFLIKNLWNSQVVPFLKATRYQGVRIDGQWNGVGENKDPEQGEVFSSEANLFLQQNAHDLTGSFLFKFKSDVKEFALDFDVKGYMWEGYITLNFTPRDKRITSYATALVKLHDGGYTLEGIWLFRDVHNEFVNQIPLVLARSESK